jgi:hypothetical protein
MAAAPGGDWLHCPQFNSSSHNQFNQAKRKNDRHPTEHNEHTGISEVHRAVGTSQQADETGLRLHSLELHLVRVRHERQGNPGEPVDMGFLRDSHCFHVPVDLRCVMAEHQEMGICICEIWSRTALAVGLVIVPEYVVLATSPGLKFRSFRITFNTSLTIRSKK